MHDGLLETLRLAQRFGFFGDRPVEEAAAHSMAFVQAIGTLPAGARVVDLGSGGGLPGLVIADEYRSVAITLIDRREKRTDFLRRATRRLEFDHVEVIDGDVEHLARQVAIGHTEPFDVVTARGFGPPEVTVRVASRLTTSTGRIVISEPPVGNRWDDTVLDELHLIRESHGSVSVFRRTGTIDDD